VVPTARVGRRARRAASRSRYAAIMPYEATRTTTRQPYCSGAMACYAGFRGERGGGDPSMACKRSGVQIPSAPPQVNAPVRLEAPPNPPPRAADRQQAALPDLLRPPKVAVTLRRSPVPSPHRALFPAGTTASLGKQPPIHGPHVLLLCVDTKLKMGGAIDRREASASPSTACMAPLKELK
jgi:hypothetical protein